MSARSNIKLLSTLSLLALAAAPAAAQNQDPPAEPVETTQADVADADAINVTGTRRTDRTLAESPVPIDVIASDALTETGYTEVNRILNQLVPSFNFPQPSVTDGTDVLRPATLRGLSPDQTLVLVNGKRRPSRPCSTSTARSAAARRRSISTPSRRSPSIASKCCATAPNPNMARTPLPA